MAERMVPEHQAHLQMLAVCHYVLGGMAAFGALAGLFMIFVGFAVAAANAANAGGAAAGATAVGGLLALMGAISLGMGLLQAVLQAGVGYFIQRREKLLYCQIVAAIECLMFPLGTVLGVFTLIVLSKPEVRTEFEPWDDNARKPHR